MNAEQRDAQFYDKAWDASWRDFKLYAPLGKHTRRWILKLLRQVHPFCTLIDLGCGEGSLLTLIKKKYPKVQLYGVDFSKTAVDISARRIPNGKFKVHDLKNPENPFGETYDIGISSEVVEHIDDDARVVRNMASWCRYLILTVPGGELNEMARQMGHLQHYSEESISCVCEQAGLDVIYCRIWGYPFSYPLYARMRDKAGYSTVIGKYGPFKKILTLILYWLFYLNDLFQGGNKIFLLAKKVSL